MGEIIAMLQLSSLQNKHSFQIVHERLDACDAAIDERFDNLEKSQQKNADKMGADRRDHADPRGRGLRCGRGRGWVRRSPRRAREGDRHRKAPPALLRADRCRQAGAKSLQPASLLIRSWNMQGQSGRRESLQQMQEEEVLTLLPTDECCLEEVRRRPEEKNTGYVYKDYAVFIHGYDGEDEHTLNLATVICVEASC